MPDAADAPVRRWIVGVDGSPDSATALTWAAAHAPGRADEMRIVTAWESPFVRAAVPVAQIGQNVVDETNAAVQQAAERDVALAADDARSILPESPAVTISTAVAHGGASAVLLNAAEHSSLLVVGNRGRGGFARLLLGSTSSQCAAHAVSPTVVVPNHSETPLSGDSDSTLPTTNRIVVGYDGSDNAVAALEWAIDFARPGTTVDVLWIWDPSPLAVGAEQFVMPEIGKATKDAFHAAIDEVSQNLSPEGVEVVHHFIEGSPRTELLDRAAEADLLVVGARGHGAIGTALLGSVSSWLLHRVDHPIALVPHG